MNIITFDIEEWLFYKQESQYRLDKLLNGILDILDEKQTKGTFFCLGYLAREYPAILKLIHSRGHEIACHSDSHKWIIDVTPKDFLYDTKTAVDSIENLIGKKVRGYRAPAFSITKDTLWALEILAECGIEYDSSIFPANRSFGGLPSFRHEKPCLVNYRGNTLKEFPIPMTTMLTKKIAYSGGGYFRLFPYSIMKKLISNSTYTMTYFHLRDFDSAQQKEFSLRYFKSYYGIKGAYNKWIQLMNEFPFINIDMATMIINWKDTPVINLG